MNKNINANTTSANIIPEGCSINVDKLLEALRVAGIDDLGQEAAVAIGTTIINALSNKARASIVNTVESIQAAQNKAVVLGDNSSISRTALDNSGITEVLLPSENISGGNKMIKRVSDPTISHTKKQRWYVQQRFYFEDDTKKRYSRSFKSQKEAEEYKSAILRGTDYISEEIRTYISVMPAIRKISDNMKFVDYINYYYTESNIPTCATRTLKCYLNTCTLISKKLSQINRRNIKLSEMNEGVCNLLLQKIAVDCSNSSVDKARLVLKQTLSYAFSKGILAGGDYTRLIKAPTIVSAKRQINTSPYSPKEVEMLLDLSNDNIKLHTVLSVFSCTGMRPEELRVLSWKNFDPVNKTIRITNASVKTYPDLAKADHVEVVGSTKSKSGIRTLPLSDKAIADLQQWREHIQKDEILSVSEYIFCDEGGSFMKEYALTSLWRRFLNRHKLNGRGYTLYRFRHTYCTSLAKNNVTIAKTKVLMGDSSTAVIDRVYTNLASADVAEEVRGIINLW